MNAVPRKKVFTVWLLSMILAACCGCEAASDQSSRYSLESQSSRMTTSATMASTDTALQSTAAMESGTTVTFQTVTELVTSTPLSTTVTTTTVTLPPILPPPAAEADLQQLLQQMTLEEKIAQMLLISCYTEQAAYDAAAFGVGGVCLYANAFSGKSIEQVQTMTAALQSDAHMPLLICVDEEGGTVNRISLNPQLRAARFLSPSKLYAQGGWALIQKDTAEKAELLLSLGVNVNLAPVCDVPISKNDYIYPRCFGMDAVQTAEYIRIVTEQMQQAQIGCSLKHFPGYGGSADTHKGFGYDNRSYETFLDRDFLPFAAGIESGAGSVMVSHNIVACMDAENPASLSGAVHGILRNTLSFEGVIITDDLGMQAVRQFCGTENAAVRAVKAGNDMLCTPSYTQSVESIAAAVRSDEIPEQQIDGSVLRIFLWKRSLGLL